MYWQYLKYILKHKWYVMLACFEAGLFWHGITHDLSKFLPDEFIPYAHWFYSEHGCKFNGGLSWEHTAYNICKSNFDIAWLKHQHRNPHHWQYWLLQKDDGGFEVLQMSYDYVEEMVCDWRGAGKAITGKDNLRGWYKENKDKMKLHEITKDYIQNNNWELRCQEN